MMRFISLNAILLSLVTALPSTHAEGSFKSGLDFPVDDKNPVILRSRSERRLQDTPTSFYTAVWFVLVGGSCAEATPPTISMECLGGGSLSLDEMSSSGVTCATDTSVATCTTTGTSTSGSAVGYYASFSCSGATIEETTASATIAEQTDDCLGSVSGGDWGRGLLLGLECGLDSLIARNGTCADPDTAFPDFTCSAGYACPDGECEGPLTLPAMTSSITDTDCASALDDTTIAGVSEGVSGSVGNDMIVNVSMLMTFLAGAAMTFVFSG